jgi:Putative lumazine-binding
MVQDTADNKAIIATAMDYFEGWFDGNPERIGRALHPNFHKRGVSVGTTGVLLLDSRTAAQMIGWTRDGEGKAERPADLAINVRIDDVHEQIATATVYSAVYIEYLQLMRTAEGWRIVNALWMRRNT